MPPEAGPSGSGGEATTSKKKTSVDEHKVAPFYACYLLRSFATATSKRTYIGSTPDPIRRKKQHNGLLTQGAHKTTRGRPWETQMLVYHFPSKIAALQFEWAWQKPHLSRHLRTHPPATSEAEAADDGSMPSPSQAQPHLPLPLFTDTPLNQVPITADGCKPLGFNSIQTSLMVARALLRSEPFSGWGLRVVFFDEYVYAAWCFLEQRLPLIAAASDDDTSRAGLDASGKSRLGRQLPAPALSPATSCDFTGVDGQRKSVLQLTMDEKNALKLDSSLAAPTSKRGKGKMASLYKAAGQWPERLPNTLTIKSVGGTWQLLEKAPNPPATLVDRTKARRTVAAAADVQPEQNASQDPRFHIDDEDETEAAWRRYQDCLRGLGKSTEDICTSKSNSAPSSARTRCALCQSAIELGDHTSYALCPSPYPELMPRRLTGRRNADQSLSTFGFMPQSKERTQAGDEDVPHISSCLSVFHLGCLSKAFLAQQRQTGHFVLPTHGACPVCIKTMRGGNIQHQTNTWNSVARSVFRRKERVEREMDNLVTERLKAARVATKLAEKRETAKTKRITKTNGPTQAHGEPEIAKSSSSNDTENIPPAAAKTKGLVAALDEVALRTEGASQVPALAPKRAVPAAWTPQPLRVAPPGRSNSSTAADRPEAENKPQSRLQPITGSPPARRTKSQPPPCDVIDLT